MPSRSPITCFEENRKTLTEQERQRRWQELAACAGLGVDPDVFFPVTQWGPSDWRTPKALCDSCPVRLQCLDYALKSHEPYGMWGGMTPVQRSAAIKRIEARVSRSSR